MTETLNKTDLASINFSEARERFIVDFFAPCFEQNGLGYTEFQPMSRRLTPKIVRSLLQIVIDDIEVQRSEVKAYMVDKKARDLLAKVGNILADLARLRGTIILPETGEEMSCMVSLVAKALKTGEPITFFTPVCPDWSRDDNGRYDFRSLGGGESFIANKFFVNAPEFLEVFAQNGVPFKGVVLFADWGLETEIDAKGTYGQKLTPDDVQMCFASTFAATDQTLKVLQEDENFGKLFADDVVVSMKDFLAKRIDEQQVMQAMRAFFTSSKQGQRLLEVLNRDSLKINTERLGVHDEENREMTLRNLVEYSTVGQAIGDNSFLVVCESRTTSRCYNMPRANDRKVPAFYIKGRDSLESGVNIL